MWHVGVIEAHMLHTDLKAYAAATPRSSSDRELSSECGEVSLRGSPITNMSQFQKFALLHRMLATAGDTLHRLRQEDNCSGNEESQQAVRPEGDPDESDPDSETWEDAEDIEVSVLKRVVCAYVVSL